MLGAWRLPTVRLSTVPGLSDKTSSPHLGPPLLVQVEGVDALQLAPQGSIEAGPRRICTRVEQELGGRTLLGQCPVLFISRRMRSSIGLLKIWPRCEAGSHKCLLPCAWHTLSMASNGVILLCISEADTHP